MSRKERSGLLTRLFNTTLESEVGSQRNGEVFLIFQEQG